MALTIIFLITLYYDNKDIIAHAKEIRAHQKSKHIQQKYHILIEFFGAKAILVQETSLTDNVSKLLTKTMTQKQLDHHLEKISIEYYSNDFSTSGNV